MISKAAQIYFTGDASRFEFDIAATKVVGRYEAGASQRLATEIRRSVDFVERSAKVGKVYELMMKRWPDETETLREDVQHGFWTAACRLWKSEDDEEVVMEWLDRAHNEDVTVEEFRAMLPKSEVPLSVGTWLRKIRDWKEYLAHLFDAMTSSKQKQKAARKAFEALKLAEEAVTELEAVE